MPRIYLPREVPVLVSAQDYDWLLSYSWWEQSSPQTGNSYAYTHLELPRENGKRRRCKVFMHRMITKAPQGKIVDHRNRMTLDNRRGNLRITSGTFNNVNRGPWGRSQYKGVVWMERNKRWRARIVKDGKETYLGLYGTEIEAALAYDRKASDLFGEFAWLNFPKPIEAEDAIERELESIPF